MSQVVDTETMSREMVEELRLRFPTVRRVVLEEGSDSTGDRALFVWVLLDDKVEDTDLSWSAIQPLVDVGRELAQARGHGAWPYVRVRREREWADRNLLPEEATA